MAMLQPSPIQADRMGAIGGLRNRAVPTGRDAGRVWRPPVSRVERARPASDKSGRLGHLAP